MIIISHMEYGVPCNKSRCRATGRGVRASLAAVWQRHAGGARGTQARPTPYHSSIFEILTLPKARCLLMQRTADPQVPLITLSLIQKSPGVTIGTASARRRRIVVKRRGRAPRVA
ncbi:hypothetical protein ACJJTC_000756 [Scirpophaga incertulas]